MTARRATASAMAAAASCVWRKRVEARGVQFGLPERS